MSNIQAQLHRLRHDRKKALAVLVDPDKLLIAQVPAFAQRVNNAKVDFIFVGGSLLMGSDLDALVKTLKEHVKMPVVLFPGNSMQLSAHADAILFLSLISGRNPDLLIGQQVMAAPYLKKAGIEVVPTAYMLVDTGHKTTVHYLSNTEPIPYHKPDIAAATALAGQYLGLQVIYLEGGSGGDKPASPEMIAAVAQTVDLPIVVGGGIRSIEQAEATLRAGAQVIVVGNALEDPARSAFLTELSELIAKS